MGVAQNIHDMEEGSLEIGMGMCLISLPVLLIFYCYRIPCGFVYTGIW